MSKQIYVMYLDKLPTLNGQTLFCAGKFAQLGNKHNVLKFLQEKYGNDLVESVSLLSGSDYDDDPTLMFAFRINLTNGQYWNGAVKEEVLDNW